MQKTRREGGGKIREGRSEREREEGRDRVSFPGHLVTSLEWGYQALFWSQGVRSIKKTDLNPVYVLIRPPSLEALVRSVSFVEFRSSFAEIILFKIKTFSITYRISLIRCRRPLFFCCSFLCG